jgi:hypothetical protein
MQSLKQKLEDVRKKLSRDMKPIFVIKLNKKATEEHIDATTNYANKSPLAKDYHLLIVKSFTNVNIEFELFNVDKVKLSDFETFKQEIYNIIKSK